LRVPMTHLRYFLRGQKMSIILRTAAILVALTLAGIPAAPVFAATVEPNSSNVELNPSAVAADGTFTIDLFMDASDEAGAHPGSFGGAVNIDFDPNLATFDGFMFNAPATLVTPPGLFLNLGSMQTISFEFENALDVGTIVTLNFTAIGAVSSIINFSLADQDDFFGTFANHVPSNQPFTPHFVGTSVESGLANVVRPGHHRSRVPASPPALNTTRAAAAAINCTRNCASSLPTVGVAAAHWRRSPGLRSPARHCRPNTPQHTRKL